MNILGIESSCDDTAAALVHCSDQGFFVVAEKTASQIDVHKQYGGVVPEIAGRQHAENIIPVVDAVLYNQSKPDVIAVTAGPGLITGLLVGVEVAKTLSYLWDIPLVATNHIAGHAHSVQIEKPEQPIEYPAVALIVSGGHTELLLMKNPTNFELIGKTRDDAAGEAFDKVGKLLGFDYPGGPKISAQAIKGDSSTIPFPRPMIDEDNYDFSFAGLKTAALYWLRDNDLVAVPTHPLTRLKTGIFGTQREGPTLNDFCASFEQAVIDTLVTKTIRAVHTHRPKTVLLGGGVSANQKLRDSLQERTNDANINLHTPHLRYAMDNAAMIAVAGYYKALKKEFTHWKDIEVDPNWRVYE